MSKTVLTFNDANEFKDGIHNFLIYRDTDPTKFKFFEQLQEYTSKYFNKQLLNDES